MTARTIPAHVPPGLVVDFDACNDPGMASDVFERLRTLRDAERPVIWSPYNGGHWMIFREKDMNEVLTQPDRFTTAYLSAASTERGGPPLIPLGIEPPEHGPYRNLLLKYLGPVQIKKLEASVRKRAKELIAPLAGGHTCEFVSQVAEPMPITIFMELMGLQLERFGEFRALALRILDPEGMFGPAEQEARGQANAQVMAMLGEVLAERHRQPKDDLVSHLISETVKGEPIGPQELLSMCYILFLGGLDTVTNAMSFGIRFLAMDKALQQELREHPDRIKETMEWLLRRSAFVNVQRQVKIDTELSGVPMKAGDMIWNVVWSGSNKPGEDQRGPRHLAFGLGHHMCLGMHLARLELRIAYETWFAHIGEFGLAANDPPVMAGGPIMHMKRLALELG